MGREVVDHRVEARNGRWRMEWRSRVVVEAMDDDGRGFPTRSSSSSSLSAAIPRLRHGGSLEVCVCVCVCPRPLVF